MTFKQCTTYVHFSTSHKFSYTSHAFFFVLNYVLEHVLVFWNFRYLLLIFIYYNHRWLVAGVLQNWEDYVKQRRGHNNKNNKTGQRDTVDLPKKIFKK